MRCDTHTRTVTAYRAPKCVLGQTAVRAGRGQPLRAGCVRDVFLASLAPHCQEGKTRKTTLFLKEPLGLREDLSAKAKAEPQSREGSRGDGEIDRSTLVTR